MSSINNDAMRSFLSRSISSLNQNKLNGILAEMDLRRYLEDLGFADRVSPGGWVARCDGAERFGHHTVVFFPEIIEAGIQYVPGRLSTPPPQKLHTICATFHQTGIASYYCTPSIATENDPASLMWSARQLGVPSEQPQVGFPACLGDAFRARAHPYNFLRHHTDAAIIPEVSLAEQFSKESIRVAFQRSYMSETSDADGIFWGQQFTYPLEIKEKTAAEDKKLGKYFGLDVGPFVKLAFYAAKRGTLHSIFIVREIDSVQDRNLVAWWYVTYEKLAQYASWVPKGGGTNMNGGQSVVVCIPKSEFSPLDEEHLKQL